MLSEANTLPVCTPVEFPVRFPTTLPVNVVACTLLHLNKEVPRVYTLSSPGTTPVDRITIT